MAGLTHFDKKGQAHMVDVGQKEITVREAVARGEIRMQPDTLDLILEGRAKKGDVSGRGAHCRDHGCKEDSGSYSACPSAPSHICESGILPG